MQTESKQNYIYLSKDSFATQRANEGKDYLWTCDRNTELPIQLQPSGSGSETPLTVPTMFKRTVDKFKDKASLFVQREGKDITWTWAQYWQDCVHFALSLEACGVPERSAVAIMGFNAPEWVVACNGAIMNNCIATGIYITNESDACLYQINHAKAEVVVVETSEHLGKILAKID